MLRKTFIFSKVLLVFSLFSILMFYNSCKKVDKALDYALDFDGIFKGSNGWEVTLSESPSGGSTPTNEFGNGVLTKAGTPLPRFAWGLGDKIYRDMVQINDNTWEGIVTDKDFNLGSTGGGTITINGDLLTVTPTSYPTYTLSKVAGGGGSGGGTGSTSQTLVEYISGSVGDKKIFKFNLPTNVVKLEIQTSEDATAYRNTADIGVRGGSAPTVTTTPRYEWNANCFGIKPNRENELCVINSPASGEWFVMLFGYNTYFSSKLTITITK